jgi:hypoxanthine-guanine phosphoribosyltransferase
MLALSERQVRAARIVFKTPARFVVGFRANRKARIRGLGDSGLLRTQIIAWSVRNGFP